MPVRRSPSLATLALGALALAALAWGLLDPRWRDAEGFLTASACLPLSWAAALGALAAAVRAGAPRAGAWLALAVVGQAASLGLVHAGPAVGYQHYRPFEPRLDGGSCALPLALLAAQALVVARGSLPLARPALAWLRERLSGWRLVALAALLAATSAKVARPASAFGGELVLASAIQLVFLANVVLAVRALPAPVLGRWSARIERVFGRADAPAGPARLDRFAWTAALAALGLAALLVHLSYEAHPHVPDEVVYLLHARYLADGRLSLPAPPVPEGFELDLMTLDGGRWFSPVPIGWPAVLALGVVAGAPWLVNPLLGAASVLLAYLFTWEIAGRRAARTVAVLLVASPWFTFLNASLMTHSLTLAAALLAAFAAVRARRAAGRGRELGWAALAGAAIGVVGLLRPLEGLALAALVGLSCLGLGGRRLRVAGLAALVLAAVAVGALTLPYNEHLTGDPRVFPIMDYVDRLYGPGKNSLGFGPEKGLGWGGLDPYPGHSLLDAAFNADFNAFAVNVELFGWGAGSLCLLAWLLLARGRWTGPERWMLAVVATIVGLHTFYWFSGGPDFGARYWYLILVPCVLLTEGALARLERADELGPRARLGVLAAGAVALATFFPWRAIDKYHHYRGMRPDVRELAREHGFGRSLVLVAGERHPDYASAAVYNPLDLEADAPIYAWDRSPEVRAALVAHYADRPVWRLAGPSVTGRGFEVVERPVGGGSR